MKTCLTLIAIYIAAIASLQSATSDTTIRMERGQFKKAHSYISTRDYDKAAKILEDNIRKYPDGPMNDYEHAWLCTCLAYLGRFQDIPKHYEIIQTRYFGNYRDSEGGLWRNWSKQMSEVRQLLSVSSNPTATATIKELDEIDRKRKQAFINQLPDLIEKAKQNDASARLALSNHYSVILDMLVNGQLKIQAQQDAAANP